MGDCEYYDPDFYDGNLCPGNCEACPTADVIISALSKMEEEEDDD